MIAQSASLRCVASSLAAMSVVGMEHIFGAAGLSLQSRALPRRGNDGNRGFLGQRQPILLARAAGARIQTPAVREPPAAILQAGAQVAGDAGAQSPRAGAGAEGRRVRVLRVTCHPLLPRPEVPTTSAVR